MTNRRDFLKTMAIGGASAIAIPSLLNSCSTEECACQGATAGNLSVQIDKLTTAGYISVEKGFKGKKPQTVCKITPVGLQAFKDYVEALQTYLK